jgi:hypothetical protein
MSYAVARAVVGRGTDDGRLATNGATPEDLDSFVRAVCAADGTRLVEEPLALADRPPADELSAG